MSFGSMMSPLLPSQAPSSASTSQILPIDLRPLMLTASAKNAGDSSPKTLDEPCRERQTSISSTRSSASGGAASLFDSASSNSLDESSSPFSSYPSMTYTGPLVLQQVQQELVYKMAEVGPDHLVLAEIWNSLGLIRLHMQRDIPAALECHEEALRIYRNHSPGPQLGAIVTPKQLAVTLSDLAKCFERMNHRAEALRKYQEAEATLLDANCSPTDLILTSIQRSISRLQRS